MRLAFGGSSERSTRPLSDGGANGRTALGWAAVLAPAAIEGRVPRMRLDTGKLEIDSLPRTTSTTRPLSPESLSLG